MAILLWKEKYEKEVAVAVWESKTQKEKQEFLGKSKSSSQDSRTTRQQQPPTSRLLDEAVWSQIGTSRFGTSHIGGRNYV